MSGRLLNQTSVLCPKHRVCFPMPDDGKPVGCSMDGGHVLKSLAGPGAVWEYCSACDTFWPADVTSNEFFGDKCRRCPATVALRYLCSTCTTLTIEPELLPAKRRISFEAGRGPLPFCPGCKREPAGPLSEHTCDFVGTTFVTARNQCPFCDGPTVAPLAPAVEPVVALASATIASTAGETQSPCPGCNEVIPLSSRFCGFCGLTLISTPSGPLTTTPVAPQVTVCAGCTRTVPSDSKFCEHCARPLAPARPMANPEATAAPTPEAPRLVAPFTFDVAPDRPRPPLLGIPKPAIIAALGLVLVVVIVGGVASMIKPSQQTFLARIGKALAENRIDSPKGDCVADLYDAERARSPQSPDLAEARKKIRASLEPKLDDLLAKRHKFTASEYPIDWRQHEPAAALLVRLHPLDKQLEAKYMFVRGMRQSDDHDNDGAFADLSKANELHPNWAIALNAVGNLYSRTDEWSRGIESESHRYYKLACNADPNYTWGYRNLGNYHLAEGNYAMAETYFLEARRTYPDYPDTLVDLAWICEKTGRINEAVGYLEAAKRAYQTRGKTDNAREAEEGIQVLRNRWDEGA